MNKQTKTIIGVGGVAVLLYFLSKGNYNNANGKNKKNKNKIPKTPKTPKTT